VLNMMVIEAVSVLWTDLIYVSEIRTSLNIPFIHSFSFLSQSLVLSISSQNPQLE
jgi:hypothetical protein